MLLGHARHQVVGGSGLDPSVACGEHDRRRGAGQPAGREGEGVQGGAVQPFRVVDAHQQGPVAGEPVQQGGRQGQPVADPAPGQGLAQRGRVRGQRAQQAFEPGQGEVGLVCDAPAVQHGEITGVGAQVGQQGALAAARAAGEEEGRAAPGPRVVQYSGEDPQFRVTAPEADRPGVGVTADHGPRFAQRGPVAAGVRGHTGRFTDPRTESHGRGRAAAPGAAARSRGRLFPPFHLGFCPFKR